LQVPFFLATGSLRLRLASPAKAEDGFNGMQHSLQSRCGEGWLFLWQAIMRRICCGYGWQAQQKRRMASTVCSIRCNHAAAKVGYFFSKPSTNGVLHLFPMWHYVYVLENKQGRQYVGLTDNVDDRVARHNRGEIPSTAKYRPWDIVHFSALRTRTKAASYEKYLKSGSGTTFRHRHLV